MHSKGHEILVQSWRNAGVGEGDVLLLHSSIKRILNGEFAKEDKLRPDDVLDSFLDALGPNGTLVVPLFNFGFTEGIPFESGEPNVLSTATLKDL